MGKGGRERLMYAVLWTSIGIAVPHIVQSAHQERPQQNSPIQGSGDTPPTPDIYIQNGALCERKTTTSEIPGRTNTTIFCSFDVPQSRIPTSPLKST
jgi:hypothetical protein